jgi:hypothetical protein
MAKHRKNPFAFLFAFVLEVVLLVFLSGAESDDHEYVSAVGDPGMRRDGLRLAIESWNQCNEVGEEVPQMGSPRAADCFDIYQPSAPQAKGELPIHLCLCFSLSSSLCFLCYFLIVFSFLLMYKKIVFLFYLFYFFSISFLYC